MNINLKAPVSTIVAISVGGIILLGYFIRFPILLDFRSTLLSAAITVTGFALLLGVGNLFYVHIDKIKQASSTALYSFILVVALFVTFFLTIFQTPNAEWPIWIFTYIHIPAETSLMAVLIFSLTFATIRLLSRKPDLFSAIFIVSMLLTLVGSGPLFGIEIPILSDSISPLVSLIFAGAGARGILLGVGLGTVATGIRILLGADRPFGG
jgi:hypothetical protein